MLKSKLVQHVFEARYEKGYKYLDRCGDVMILLEDGLPEFCDGQIWMPEEIQPSGARLKCPALDLLLVFDSGRMCLDQQSVDTPCNFEKIIAYVLDTLISKFDLRTITRLGNRSMYIAASDSIEEAENLSLKMIPLNNWPIPSLADLVPHRNQAEVVFETDDKLKGCRISTNVVNRVEAPMKIDRRLTMAPHLLPTGQHDALIDQLKRQKIRQQDPVAGMMIDIDYWWIKPGKFNIIDFFKSSSEQATNILNNIEAFK